MSDEQKSETRAAILTAARERYISDGPKTSIRQIARDADVSVALVYHYFKNKEEVYDACINEMYEKLPAIMIEAQAGLAASAAPAEYLDVLVRKMYRFACEHRPWLQMLQRSVLENRGLDSTRRDNFQKPFLDVAAAGIAQATGQSEEYLRLAVQSVVLLIVRYAVSDEVEVEVFTRKVGEEASRELEDHLVEVGSRILLSPTS